MELELISFKLCPFVQRSVITLLHKHSPYRITYIDLADPPPWFLDISPFGKVPVLKVDSDTVLFESAIINEFIDDVTGGELQPKDPLRRAINRGWTEFGSACLMDAFGMVNAKTSEQFEDKRDDLTEKLERLESRFGSGPYFNGADLSLVDTAYAPLFLRLDWMQAFTDIVDWTELPKLSAWRETLLALPAVKDSVANKLPAIYQGMIRAKAGYLAQCAT